MPDDIEVIANSHVETLYTHSAENGRFFQIVYEDEEWFEFMVSRRIAFKVFYGNASRDLKTFQIIQVEKRSGQEFEKGKIQISSFGLLQLRQFLELLQTIDLWSVTERKIRLNSWLFENVELDEEWKNALYELLRRGDSSDLIEALLNDGAITQKDIVNTGYRKQQLEIFEKLMDSSEFFSEYKTNEGLSPGSQSEKVWQHFFKKNEWIFWYWLQYRFQGILQREAHLSDQNIDGTWWVITDFLLSDNLYTTFVEIKKPETPLFWNNANRSNSWKLSSELIEGVSQILEQKAIGQIKIETEDLYDETGNLIMQWAYDAKSVLIIWRIDQTVSSSEREQKIKRKTFELYRRDSRNIEILTYDELLNRAKHIVDSASNRTPSTTDNLLVDDEVHIEDIPF